MKSLVPVLLFLLLVISGFQQTRSQQPNDFIPSALNRANVQLIPGTVRHAASKETAEGEWEILGTVTSEYVTQSAVAGDESRLVVFYREPHGDLNQDWGILKEWSGTEWVLLTTPTLQCHDPDVAVKGDIVVSGWEDDGLDYGFCSNVNGPWVSITSSMLVHSYGTRVTIAQSRGYLTFAARYSDGMPSSYMMLHIHSPLGAGEAAELNGGWTQIYTDVGTSPVIYGDENFWISAFTQAGGVGVKKGIVSGSGSVSDLGGLFHVAGYAGSPCACIRNGIPAAFWIEGESDSMYAAEWNGTSWQLIGEGILQSGTYMSLSAASSGSVLYVAYTVYDGENYTLSVDSWNGESWSTLPAITRASSSSDIYTFDISVYQGMPVVAFVEDGVVKVEKYSPSVSVNETPVVNDFSLSRNYPNPFNPYTTISYRIPGESYVTLKVFDALGREVKTLVSEQKTAGSYETVFEGTGIPSGIYLYKLTAGNYSEIKKMLLLK